MLRNFLNSAFLTVFILSGCSNPDETIQTSTDPAIDDPVIYVSVFTHAEQPGGKDAPDFLSNEDTFWEQRQNVIDFASMLHEKGVAYDYQSDWNFLEAALKFDEGDEASHGKNFLQYLHEDLGADIDPHNHTGQSKYNYADVAYLITQLGVDPTGVVGGFIVFPLESSALEDLLKPVEGNVYDYTWTPEILWGGGSGNHVNDADYLISGVWRPQDSEHFDVNDPSAALPIVGHYTSSWEGLDELLEMQENGELEEGHMYTVSIDAHQKNLDEAFIAEFAAKIDAHQEYVDSGRMQWVSISDVVEIWEEQYDSVPTILHASGESDIDADLPFKNKPFGGSLPK